ncbi:hypothetical protein IC229_19735 [Spirosoma sp. BT702]|uniref:Uncharacterized protein n=1 Tax=Spirosoma profusum TaxID=2771354 RepID=A0A926Y2X9_9BACT|nr:hypothetical protein [Spirosoma profusum]MBD2702888.1 hypothetical protein [Spirosoma profusum]
MERFLTVLFASLCAAPLGFFIASWPLLSAKGGNSDQTIANGYGGILFGIVGAVLAFILTWYFANNLIVKGHIRTIQIVDLVMVIGWGIVWFVFDSKQPYLLEYSDHTPVLEVEVRVKKSALNGKPIDKAVEVMFVGSSLTYYRDEQIHEEGDSVIRPWYGYMYSIKDWSVRVYLDSLYGDFQLNIPRRPMESTEWSGWINPTPNPEDKAPDGVSIRYRFRLVPHGQDP